jgi:hypothetical protein
MYAGDMNIEKIKTAAEKGESKAAFDLGWCCYIGSGVPRNTEEAGHWYRVAAAGGIREAGEILHVLETEASRAAELEVLPTGLEMLPRRTHRVAWWAGVALIGLVAALAAFRQDLLTCWLPYTEKGAPHYEEPIKQATTRDSLPSTIPPLPSAPEDANNMITARDEKPPEANLVEAEAKPSSSSIPTTKQQEFRDANTIIEFAEKWLEEQE